MERFKLTLIGLFFSSIILFVNITFDLDLFERYTTFLGSGDPYYLDEVAISVTILLFFLVFDVFRRVRKETLENEKLKIYQAMMLSHNHIINNFLNQALLFRMAAEDTPGFDPEEIKQYDKITKETQAMIRAVGSISEISEDSILNSVMPKTIDDSVEYEWDNNTSKLVPKK